MAVARSKLRLAATAIFLVGVVVPVTAHAQEDETGSVADLAERLLRGDLSNAAAYKSTSTIDSGTTVSRPAQYLRPSDEEASHDVSSTQPTTEGKQWPRAIEANPPTLSDAFFEAHRKKLEELHNAAQSMPPIVIPPKTF